MTNEPYTTVVSGAIPKTEKNERLSFGYSEWYAIGNNIVVHDTSIECPLFEALLWDYFHQHFYEWVRL